ncbi:MAG: DUF2190 family protein [Bacteroidetes bacterium]|nr:DUF2190 family protein [Bacteroidota bacterium]MBU1115329.1 DUF2190 family protein [Bacteroidota bacterium]MBU1799682.1 DUF2190 family protein [Bacteroidota bacterium]
MKTEQIGIVTSIKNESGDTILKGYFVNMQGVLGNSEENNNEMIGVCIADTNDGEMMPVAVTGIVLCVTGGIIYKGNPVSCDGKIYKVNFTDPPTTSELQRVVGKALDAATAADQLVRVLLK